MKLFKPQVNKNNGKGWMDMSYSPRQEKEGQLLIQHYQSNFPSFDFVFVPIIKRIKPMDFEKLNPVALALILLTIVTVGAHASITSNPDLLTPVDLQSTTVYGE